jgi:hypothetical protein
MHLLQEVASEAVSVAVVGSVAATEGTIEIGEVGLATEVREVSGAVMVVAGVEEDSVAAVTIMAEAASGTFALAFFSRQPFT